MLRETSYGIIPLQKQKHEWIVLLIQHRAGHWSFPKGHPELDEEPKQTAERELHEETGLTITRYLSDAPLKESYQFKREEKKVDKTVNYFLAEVEGDVILHTEELKDSKWVSIKDAASHVTFPAAKRLCEQVSLSVQFSSLLGD